MSYITQGLSDGTYISGGLGGSGSAAVSPAQTFVSVQLGPFFANPNALSQSWPVSGVVVDVSPGPISPGSDPFAAYPSPGTSPFTATTDVDGYVYITVPYGGTSLDYYRATYPAGALDPKLPGYVAILLGAF